jgi:serine/threonine-protein kinase
MQPNGRVLGGRYELTALIATGGMGQVWEARDTVLNRDVAVKVLRSEYTGDPTFLARFRAEAQHSAGLVHPNIATLFDYGEVAPTDPRGEHLAYLVMELVRGESLSGLLRRERRLSPERTLDILRQSAAGLAAAHAAGVVHRDVKPGNVLLGSDGAVKITDFGVAVSAASVSLTQTGQVIGTAHYLSPEQAQGARATPASDVYALGVVGYECLSGHRAFDAESSVQVALMQIRHTPEPLPDDVPPGVRRLIESAMVKDPSERFPDAAAFRDAIDDVIAGRPLRQTVPYARTAVLPAVTAAAAAGGTAELPVTRTMPAVIAEPDARPRPEPDPPEEQREGRRRRRILVPLVALLAVAAVVLGGLQLVGSGSDADGGTATGPTTPATSSAPSTPPSTPTVQLVDVVSADYAGRPVSEVQAELTARGLIVSISPQETGDVADGLVISVDPAGPLTPNSPVTITYAVAPPPPPAPTPAPAATSAGGDSGQSEDEPDEDEPDEGSQWNGNGNGWGNGRGDGRGNGRGNG